MYWRGWRSQGLPSPQYPPASKLSRSHGGRRDRLRRSRLLGRRVSRHRAGHQTLEDLHGLVSDFLIAIAIVESTTGFDIYLLS
jgi:hypothetical protein